MIDLCNEACSVRIEDVRTVIDYFATQRSGKKRQRLVEPSGSSLSAPHTAALKFLDDLSAAKRARYTSSSESSKINGASVGTSAKCKWFEVSEIVSVALNSPHVPLLEVCMQMSCRRLSILKKK